MESAASEMLARIALVKPVICANTFMRMEVAIDFAPRLRVSAVTSAIEAPSLRSPVLASVLRQNLASMKNLISMLATRTSQVSRYGLWRFHLMPTARWTTHGVHIETLGAYFQKLNYAVMVKRTRLR